MKLTLNIPDKNSEKALSLIEYLKSLDFITIEQEEDIAVPEWHKEIVRERLKNPDSDQLLDWDKVKDSFTLE